MVVFRIIRIVNKEELLENAVFNEDRKAREVAVRVLRVALNSADPRTAIRNHVHRLRAQKREVLDDRFSVSSTSVNAVPSRARIQKKIFDLAHALDKVFHKEKALIVCCRSKGEFMRSVARAKGLKR